MPISLKGTTSGQVTLTVPAVAGSGTLTLPTTTDTIATLTSNTFTTPSVSGSITLNGATSGSVALIASAVAGSNTLTLPAATGTILASTAVSASTTNTVTNKIAVNIGGTVYYILASTSGT